MANISKITALNGITYDLKDALARDEIIELQNVVDAMETGAFVYKGSVESAINLPVVADLGDLYTVTDEGNAQYVFDGMDFIKLNNQAITNAQIDILFN